MGYGRREQHNFPFLNGVDEYQVPVEPTSLSTKSAAGFLEVASLLNYRVEQTVIHNETNQDNNKVLEYAAKHLGTVLRSLRLCES